MPSLVLLLICLSLHASNARYLGVADLETNKGFQLLGKGLEEEKRHRTSIPSSVKSFFYEGMQKQVKQIVRNYETGAHESWGVANYIDHCTEKDKVVVGVAGNEVMASSAQEILQDQATKIDRVRKRQARRMLRSTPEHADETLNSKKNVVVEDIFVMDYAQPHRKPPIHN